MLQIAEPEVTPATNRPPLLPQFDVDPFGPDDPDDVLVMTSERRLRRLAISAADAGVRFARDAIPYDPAAWMFTPLPMFCFARPLEACQDLDGFSRSSLLHGLHLGLDAGPEELDALLCDDDLPDGFEITKCNWVGENARLFTAVIEGGLGAGGVVVRAFCAMMAESADALRARLRSRYDAELVEVARIVEGYEASPVGDLLLSPDMKLMLAEVAADPRSPRAEGLEVQLDKRGAA